jgi:hypothetical protein
MLEYDLSSVPDFKPFKVIHAATRSKKTTRLFNSLFVGEARKLFDCHNVTLPQKIAPHPWASR